VKKGDTERNFTLVYKKTTGPDRILLGTVVALVLLGLVILASASVVISQERFQESYYFLRHQVIYGAILGIIFAWIAYKIPFKWWEKLSLPILLLGFLLLILVFVPDIGYGRGGASRWIQIADISLQPSEIAKLGFILYLAAWLKHKEKKFSRISESLLPFLFISGLLGFFLILQPDIGTLGIISITGAAIYFLSGAPLRHMGIIMGSGVALFLVLLKIAPYRANRITAFFNPQIDPLGISYQINQALIAIGSGGFLGFGLGHSRQKYNFLPEPISDSIFAIWSEEAGFIGAVILISLFLLFIWRGFKISLSSRDPFSRLAGAGITTWIGLQAFINIGSISGLMPLTGMPLPFVSYGGSALIISLVGVAILLRISKENK